MYAFILIVTVTLSGLGSHTFVQLSKDQYSPTVCEKMAQEAAEQMQETLSKSTSGVTIEIRPSCVLLATRRI